MSFNSLRNIALLLIVFCFIFVIFFGIYCPPSICFSHERIYVNIDQQNKGSSFKPHSFISKHFEEFLDEDINNVINVNLNKDDVLVFLHIQKSGGTLFEKHLVKFGVLNFLCNCDSFKMVKKCDCPNINGHNWLFSRYSVGWRCGLHADWTELKSCVDKKLNKLDGVVKYRKLYFFTVLRNPVSRYISEWHHVQRGATWSDAKMKCNGQVPSEGMWPFCYKDMDWSGVTLKDFLKCPYNLAHNRQTRMLANLSLVHCYNLSALPPEVRDSTMLTSAKTNLREMPYLGIMDHLIYSQYLFQRTFGLVFKEIFIPWNHTHANSLTISDDQMQGIHSKTVLDIELYDFALQLFYKRLRYMISTDPDIPSHIKNEVKQHVREPTWFQEAESWLTPYLIKILYKHGSRYPSQEKFDKRLKRWQKKLSRELSP